MMRGELARRAEDLLGSRVPFVSATVVRARHPTSVRPGDAALVLADGTIEGFVGGTCAQASVRLHAARVLETGEPLVLRLVPGNHESGAAGAGEEADAPDGTVVEHNPCLSGGSIELFLEPQLPPPRMVVVGDAPIARALEALARATGYDVLRGDPSEVEPQTTDAAVVVASHGEGEEPVLVQALERGVGYVALVSSAVRGAAVRDALDVAPELRSRLHAPAGLPIGASSPAEVAIAILAELVAAGKAQPAAPTAATAAARPATAVDPVCGMEVLVSDTTLRLDVGGEPVYFCCDGCRSTYAERRSADVSGADVAGR
jgi:xanthine dehydrogenase accessory factor